MKKIAVVYTSKYGSTEKYAKWIAEDLEADIFNQNECKINDILEYDTIVYGGAVHAGGILGLDFIRKNIKKLKDKKIIAFAVGLSFDNDETKKECIEINFVKKLSGIPCFFFKGAYDPEKVTGMDKTLMKVVKKMISGGKMDDSQKALLDAIENGGDYTNRESVKEIVDYVQKL